MWEMFGDSLSRIDLNTDTSTFGLSVDTLAPRATLSLELRVSTDKASYHRDKQLKLMSNSIFLSSVSRVLSTKRYKIDLSSGKFYRKKTSHR
jgi:hypothetical protein